MRALEAVRDWPVRRAAAAVVDTGGVVDEIGPVDEPFGLASVTKPLTALACLVAVEEGAIELDQPVDRFPGVTVRHLLAHASGMAPEDAQLVAKPATRRIYSNAGFEVLGGVVEQAAGMAFGDYFRQAVVEPLGLAATTLDGSPAYGANASANDLAAVAQALLAGGAGILHQDTLAEATTVQFPGLSGVVPGFGRQQDNDWGLGFEIRDSKSPHWTGSTNSPATYGHFGRSGTFLWVDPVAGLACVALTDTEFEQWAKEAWPALSDAVLRSSGGPARASADPGAGAPRSR